MTIPETEVNTKYVRSQIHDRKSFRTGGATDGLDGCVRLLVRTKRTGTGTVPSKQTVRRHSVDLLLDSSIFDPNRTNKRMLLVLVRTGPYQ
jgi:hypothetical protein